MFISSERRKVTASFDQYVGLTQAALRDPHVQASLGRFVTDLQLINDNLFLPDLTRSGWSLPRNQNNTSNIAMIPVSDVTSLTNRDLNSVGTELQRMWSAPGAYRSEFYGLELPHEVDAMFRPAPPTKKAPHVVPAERLGIPLGRTMSRFFRTHDSLYGAYRPIILVTTELLGGAGIDAAVNLAHEESHVSDILYDGPVFGTNTYRGATELHGYFVSASLYRALGGRPGWGVAREDHNALGLDGLREQRIGRTRYPFTPDTYLEERMRRNGITA